MNHELKQLEDQLKFYKTKFQEFVDITMTLNGTKNLGDVLWDMLYFGRDFTHAQAGTLYKVTNDKLQFSVVQNDPLNIHLSNHKDEIRWDDIPINEENEHLVSVHCVHTQNIINIEDVYQSTHYDFSGTKKFDEANNFRTQSVLVIPVISPENKKIIGVLQLINKLDENGSIVSFTQEDADIIYSLASLCAIILERLEGELKQLKLLNKQLKKSKEITDKLTQDNLQYASYIQQSLHPNADTMKKIYTDFFLIHNKKDQVSPLLYNHFQLHNGHSVFLLLNTKVDGIKNAFFSMLVNGICDETIENFKNNDLENMDLKSLYTFMDEAIKVKLNSKISHELSLIYYNTDTNTMSIRNHNSLVWYNQDDTLHTLDTSSLEENIINIKDNLTLYIGTPQVLCHKDDTNTLLQNMTEPFGKQQELFTNSFCDTPDDLFFCGFKIDNKLEQIIEYDGVFTQELLIQFSDTIEEKVENIGTVSNILTIFSEQFQNTLKYSKSENEDEIILSSKGSIAIEENQNQYIITSKNIITREDKEKIEPKFIEIKSLDRQGIRKRYKELRKSGANTHENGGGIGMYEIAKRCNDMFYSFEELNAKRFLFIHSSVIEKK